MITNITKMCSLYKKLQHAFRKIDQASAIVNSMSSSFLGKH